MKKSFVILICIHLILNSYAQQFNFKNFNLAEGLPQSSVYDIFQDSKGFIWLGTQGGVSRFNGIDFNTFSQKNNLADNHVKAICEDNYSNIWTGHRYDGFSCISKNKIFNNHPKELNSDIIALTNWKNGVMGISSSDGIFNLELTNDSIHIKNVISVDTNKLTRLNEIKSNNKQLYIATSNGLIILDENLKFKSKLLDQSIVYDFDWDTNNELIVISSKGLTFFKENEVVSEISLENTFTDIAISKTNEIYVSNKENGALIFKENYIQALTTKNNLLSNKINTILFDNENNLWIGSEGDGVSQVITAKFQAYDKFYGLQNNQVTTLLMDHNNRLWVGAKSELDVILIDNKKRKSTTDIIHVSKLFNFKLNNLRSVFEDNKNNIWLGTNDGVYIIDENFNLVQHLTTEDGISDNYIISICQDINGFIWLASYNNGISKIDISLKEIQIESFFKSDGLCSNKFWTVFSSKKGLVYFGSDDAGVSVWDGEGFQTLNHEDGLLNLRAGSITEDINGNIWVGTIGGGIFKYDGTKFIQFDSKNGLSSNNPYLIIADNFGKVWVGTNSGLDVISDTTGSNSTGNKNLFKHYGINQGFTGVETNQNAKFKDKNGDLWFGTVKGAIKCNAKEITFDSIPPLMHFTSKKLFLKNEIENSKKKFKHTENHLSFEFIGLHFGNPHQVTYSYKLKNFDKDWSPWSKRNRAIYSYLPSGKYTLYIKGANGDMVESDLISYEFEIIPPFWEREWFIILICFVVLISFYLILKFRSIKAEKNRVLLLEKVELRTRELNKEKIKVTKQKEIIELKNNNITDSINYAKNIQQAVLPNVKILESFFSDFFIYNQPRDIVSGDFYWFKKKGDYLIIACADCTGHGIPGAFLSMLGSELMNQIILDPKVNSPGLALELLDIGIYNSIHRSGDSFQKDGIDLSICAFNQNENIFTFSGARRPIILWDGEEIHTFESMPCSVGEMNQRNETPIELEIPIKKGDRIYMFSDGYIDQFGGEKNKKFLIRRFKELILELDKTPLNKQKDIFKEKFNSWKKNEEQLDDVLVIGVEI
jgi:ligand-binding sensor domain-containing protein/serine phosphatase RsbU (regulator of sigma subunit)